MPTLEEKREEEHFLKRPRLPQMTRPMMLLLILLPLAMIASVVGASAYYSYSVNVNSSGNVVTPTNQNVSIAVFDANNAPLTNILWGSPAPGQTVTHNVNLKNTGDLIIQPWCFRNDSTLSSPAVENIEFSTDLSELTRLTKGQQVNFNISIHVPANYVDGSFSFKVVFSGGEPEDA